MGSKGISKGELAWRRAGAKGIYDRKADSAILLEDGSEPPQHVWMCRGRLGNSAQHAWREWRETEVVDTRVAEPAPASAWCHRYGPPALTPRTNRVH
jgi:hypothetical protein